MKNTILKELKGKNILEEIKDGNFNFIMNLRELPHNPGVYLLFFRFPKDSLEFLKNMSEEDIRDLHCYLIEIIVHFNIMQDTSSLPKVIKFSLDCDGSKSFMAYICKEPSEPNKQEKIELLNSEVDMDFNEYYKEETK